MITFIFAVYNQQHVLEKSIISLQKYLIDRSIDDSEIIICNDGSPDKCVEISDGLSKQFNNVISIGYKRNRGRGFAIKYAGTLAQGEHLLCLDCDLIIDRNFIFIDKMIKYIRIYDVVIASRFHPKARSNRKFIRRFVSQVYRHLVKILFSNFPVTDPDVGFKGYNKKVFQQINISTNLNGPSWDLQFLTNAAHEGYDIFEFPFSYIEDYKQTTVNIITCSIIEFIGMIYIRITLSISKRIIF